MDDGPGRLLAKLSPPGRPILTRPPTGHPAAPGPFWQEARYISFGHFLLPIRVVPGHFWIVSPWKSELSGPFWPSSYYGEGGGRLRTLCHVVPKLSAPSPGG